MSYYSARPAKQDRFTIFGVFAIVALLPTVFSVAYEFDARGLTSGRTWLMASFPMVLLVATRFIPAVWHRSRPGRWTLVGLAVAAGLAFCWHMTGLFGFLTASPSVRYLAPVVLAAMYAGFGLIVGRAHSRTGRSRQTSVSASSSGRPEMFSRR